MNFIKVRKTSAIRPGLAALGLVFTAACSSTIHTTSKLGNHSVLAVDAKQRLVISGVRSANNANVICAEPSPDALVANASYAAATLNAKDDVQAQTAVGISESVGSIGLRTQTIQLLRDGYYRVCEAYMNGAIDIAEYRGILHQIDMFMIALVAIEAVGGVVAAPAIALGTTGKVTVGDEQVSGEAGTSNTLIQIEKIVADSQNISKENAAVILELVKEYGRNRAESLAL